MNGFLHKGGAHAAPPEVRFDEQAVELAADHGGKAGHLAIQLGHDHLTVGDLRGRQMDRVGMGFEMRAVDGVGERGAPLKLFQSMALIRLGKTDDERLSAL